jgi:hypothetical protein
LNNGVMRMTRIRERMGFQVFSPFSSVQAYSQIPQPVHLLGSTETNFRELNLAGCISVTKVVGTI